jgi:glucosylceramidase
MVTAVQNPDESISVVIFNPSEEAKGIKLTLRGITNDFAISAKALQTVVIPK